MNKVNKVSSEGWSRLLRLKWRKNKVCSGLEIYFFCPPTSVGLNYLKRNIHSFISMVLSEPVSKNLIFVFPNLNSHGLRYKLTLFTLFPDIYLIARKTFEYCFSVRVTGSANLSLGNCSKSPGHYILKFVLVSGWLDRTAIVWGSCEKSPGHFFLKFVFLIIASQSNPTTPASLRRFLQTER